MANILGYEFETDEEFNELIDDEMLVQVGTYDDNELYDAVIDHIDSVQMADIIFQMIDEGNFKDALNNIGMIEEYGGEAYIEGVYVS